MTLQEEADAVLAAIKYLIGTSPIPPTYREVAQHLGWTAHSRVFRVVQYLRKEGLVYDPKNSRARSLFPTSSLSVGEHHDKQGTVEHPDGPVGI